MSQRANYRLIIYYNTLYFRNLPSIHFSSIFTSLFILVKVTMHPESGNEMGNTPCMEHQSTHTFIPRANIKIHLSVCFLGFFWDVSGNAMGT